MTSRTVTRLLILVFALVARQSGQDSDSSLNLKVEPIQHRYCKGDSEITFLQVRSTFEYANKGRTALLLKKGETFVQAIRIATSATALARNDYVMNISRTSALNPSTKETPPPKSSFVSLKSGESFKASDLFDLPVVLKPSLANRAGVLPGHYFVQLLVSTWQGSDELAGRTEAALAIGRIWTAPIRSEAIALDVDPANVISDCSKYPF
jgi:hypothetical protein